MAAGAQTAAIEAELAAERAKRLVRAYREGRKDADAATRRLVECLAEATAQRKQVLQLCQWRVVENIKKRVRRAGYPQDVLEGVDDRIWAWVRAKTKKATSRSISYLKCVSSSRDG